MVPLVISQLNLSKEVSDIYSLALNDICNNEIITQKGFPHNLKLAYVTPVFKKEDISLLMKYRPVSVLLAVSKIYERIMQKQILEYISKHISPHLCGYRKGYSTKTGLIFTLEKWKLSIVGGVGFAGGVLMDLSNAFDAINHPLSLAKLHGYGFRKNALAIACSYLSNRKQRTKINNIFSSWKELILGVPNNQGDLNKRVDQGGIQKSRKVIKRQGTAVKMGEIFCVYFESNGMV